MEDQYDEQHFEVLVHSQRQPNQYRVQQNPKLQNKYPRDLRQRAVVQHREHAAIVRDRHSGAVALLSVFFEIGAVITLVIILRLGPVSGMSVGTDGGVSVCVVLDAHLGELGVAPAEGDEFDEEESEDGEHGEGESPGLDVR